MKPIQRLDVRCPCCDSPDVKMRLSIGSWHQRKVECVKCAMYGHRKSVNSTLFFWECFINVPFFPECQEDKETRPADQIPVQESDASKGGNSQSA